MRELTKAEKKLYLSWFAGFLIGFREAYDQIKANTGDAWNNLKFFKRVKYNKTQFNRGYNKGHELYLNVIGKDWDEINPELYRDWYKRHFLYNYIYDEERVKDGR